MQSTSVDEGEKALAQGDCERKSKWCGRKRERLPAADERVIDLSDAARAILFPAGGAETKLRKLGSKS
jgi:hypothetical protein